jgi:hypothetical protein
VPLAACEWLLDERIRAGWRGGIAPALCLDCMTEIRVGDTVAIRGGRGVVMSGDEQELPAGSSGIVAEVSSWAGEGSIYLVRLPSGDAVYAARSRLAPAVVKPG